MEEATPNLTSLSARHTSVSIATRRTTQRRTSCGCRASPAATCTLFLPSPWTRSPGRTSPPPSSHDNSWSSGRSWGRGSLERWAGKGRSEREKLHLMWLHRRFLPPQLSLHLLCSCRSTCVRLRDSQNSSGRGRPFPIETATQYWWLLNSWEPTPPAKPGTVSVCETVFYINRWPCLVLENILLLMNNVQNTISSSTHLII